MNELLPFFWEKQQIVNILKDTNIVLTPKQTNEYICLRNNLDPEIYSLSDHDLLDSVLMPNERNAFRKHYNNIDFAIIDQLLCESNFSIVEVLREKNFLPI